MKEETNGQETNEQETGIDRYFFHLVAMFEAAAMQQLGKIAHPLTGEVKADLPGAHDSIEMLSMFKRKCVGNLNEDETRLLEHVLHQLQMNYVDVSAEKSDESGGEDGDEASGAGDGGDSDGGDGEGASGAGDGGDSDAGDGDEASGAGDGGDSDAGDNDGAGDAGSDESDGKAGDN